MKQGGVFGSEGYFCAEYFGPKRKRRLDAHCLNVMTADRECLQKWKEYIPGDDSEFLVDQLLDFLENRDTSRPFLALVHLHTIHVPHPALPEFYRQFPPGLGDYLGTVALR